MDSSKHIDEVDFVIFDTETTGLVPASGDRIVELAAVRFRGRQKLGEFESLVNPGRPVSAAAFAVNKINPQMLQSAPRIEDIMPDFLSFIEGAACLCSYNAGFDLGFLNNELALIGRPRLEGIVVVDVLSMARRLLPGLDRYALWFVARRLGIEDKQKHRALSDVEITLEVFNKLKGLLKPPLNVSSFKII